MSVKDDPAYRQLLKQRAAEAQAIDQGSLQDYSPTTRAGIEYFHSPGSAFTPQEDPLYQLYAQQTAAIDSGQLSGYSPAVARWFQADIAARQRAQEDSQQAFQRGFDSVRNPTSGDAELGT